MCVARRAQAEELPLPLLSAASLAADPHQTGIAEACNFPGANALASMRQLAALRKDVDELYVELTERQGWLTAYNVRHGFSSPWRIAEALGRLLLTHNFNIYIFGHI